MIYSKEKDGIRELEPKTIEAVLTKTPEDFGKSVEDFIRERGVRDLPKCQFEGKTNPEDYPTVLHYFKAIQEMRGYLKIPEDGKLTELSYSHPSENFLCTKWDRIVQKAGELDFPMLGALDANYLIHYHSHPNGDTKFSADDLMVLGRDLMFSEIIEESGSPLKCFYNVIYVPLKDKVVWYKTNIKDPER